MTLLYPGEKVSRRWEGALQARLRRAPIEVFLHTHALKVSASGASQVTDNLIRATVHIVERSLSMTDTIADAGQIAVSTIACSICHELTSLISEPDSWRIAALVSAAELLSPSIGRKAAAYRAAACAREFVVGRQTQSVAPIVWQIGVEAARAVRSDLAEDLAGVGHLIEQCLSNSRNAGFGADRARPPIAALLPASTRRAPKLQLVVDAGLPRSSAAHSNSGRSRDSL